MQKSRLNRRSLLGYLGLGVAAGAGSLWGFPLAVANAGVQLPVGKALPEFTGATGWLNTPGPIEAKDLLGSVALIHIWTFACINCQRTLPYVVQWHEKYAARGLKVVGVHTPEFAYERDTENIKRAIKQHKISYPNAVDNKFALWKAYDNQYWPHLFLADRQGRLRYDHIGEGAYDATEQAIRTLLGA